MQCVDFEQLILGTHFIEMLWVAFKRQTAYVQKYGINKKVGTVGDKITEKLLDPSKGEPNEAEG